MRSQRSILAAAGLAASALLAFGAFHAGAQQGGATPRQIASAKVATLDMIKILQRLIESPEYAQARSAVEEQWSGQVQPLETELRAMQEQLGGAPQDDPKTAELRTQFQTKLQQYQQLAQQSQQAMQMLQVEQLTEGYEKILAAADAIAQREGYSHVLASRGRQEGLQPESLFQDIIARPVLVSPAEDDITERVIDELNIPEPAPAPAPEAPAEAPAYQPSQPQPPATPEPPAQPGSGGGEPPKR